MINHIFQSFSVHFLSFILEEYWKIWTCIVCTYTCTCLYCKSLILYMVRTIWQIGFTSSHELMLHKLTVCWDVGAGPTNFLGFNHLMKWLYQELLCSNSSVWIVIFYAVNNWMNFCVMYISSVRYTSFLGMEHSIQSPNECMCKTF
jgi:hypothetical protein